ncbi:FadR/GntR family transcriptional regulator [Tunicatimonas pelagia]|uniref:FadR/GntR family transcriptional regulator n=1 Tax=Tunicatimonas pelagia TaxID=931531 RepID=UPI0026651D4A|nr:FCD domain-containing protein [Tunicatimonas pelagia]WKN44195.1 FCD domain-containing protein [Tunicatimonas pelagia]
MADKIEIRLQQYFKKHQLKPGDAIPKEIELAEALGVSRNVVREALSRFRMLGMVESRKKRGMILANPDVFAAMDRVLDPQILDEKTIEELFEMRLVIEMGIADLLFARITDQDILSLLTIVEKERKAVSDEVRVRCDMNFHGTLYEVAGNNLLKRFQKLLTPVFNYYRELEQQSRRIVSPVTHQDIIDTLKQGTPADYREAMREHLKPKFERL